MSRKLVEIASELIQAQVSVVPMSAADIALSLRQVFKTLQAMQQSESAGTDIEEDMVVDGTSREASISEVKPSLTPEGSIQNDKVICLECGAEMKQLTLKHLKSHGMSSREYKKKHGFPMRTPLAAKSLTRARSKAAKKRGLPENLQKFIEARRASKEEAPPDSEAGAPVAENVRIRKRSDSKNVR